MIPIIDESNTYFDRVNNKANAPSLPLGVSKYEGPLSYSDFSAPGKEGVAMKGAIYTFEVLTNQEELTERPCIVVGGVYDEAVDNDGEELVIYYRVDFMNKDKTIYLDLLRNHSYEVKILNVSQKGYPDVDEAYRSRSINIDYNILVWNNPNMGNITTDGQYFLSVSKDDFELCRNSINEEEENNVLHILTDYSTTSTSARSGWYVEKIVEADGKTTPNWLKLSVSEGNANEKTKVYIKLEENIDIPREATIWIAAGRMRYPIKILQTDKGPLSLSIDEVTPVNLVEDIETLVFPSGIWEADPIETRSIAIDWEPYANDHPCYSVATILSGGGFDFGVGTSMPEGRCLLTDPAGTVYYNDIKPDQFTKEDLEANPFHEESTLYEYIVNDGEDHIVKTLIVKQVHHDAIIETSGSHLMNGEPYKIRVKSNCGWKLELINDEKGVIRDFSPKQGGYHIDGEVVTIYIHDELSNPHENWLREAQPKFKLSCLDPDQHFDSKEFSIDCYSLAPPTGMYEATEGILGIGEKSGDLTLDGSGRIFNDKGEQEKVWIVYFKWGSLIGINGNATSDPWVNGVGNIGWTHPEFAKNGGLKSITNFESVPYYGDTTGFDNSLSMQELYEQRTTMARQGFGDPCRYAKKNGVVGQFMTPKRASLNTNWTSNPSTYFMWSDNPAGRTDRVTNLFYPAAGYRHSGGVNNTWIGVHGAYWFSDPATQDLINSQEPNQINTHATDFVFNSGSVYVTVNPRKNPHSIRCIKDPQVR